MQRILFRCLSIFLSCLMLLGLSPAVSTEEEESPMARDISGKNLVKSSQGFISIYSLFDGHKLYNKPTTGDAYLTLEHSDGIGSLYFIFGTLYGEYTVTDNATGETRILGTNGFLHEFADLEALFGYCPTSVTVTFNHGSVLLYELAAYTAGQVPDSVERWDLPLEGEADLVLFSTHGDDEQLFFAGLLPYYAGELGYNVQVVYLTDHSNTSHVRIHEMLNGLWAVGVRAYPVFGQFPDFYKQTLDITYEEFEAWGYPKEELLDFVVTQIRRFRPQVVVAHDFNGEYGHGQHLVYADLVALALEITADGAYFPASAETYGLWDVPKAYFHLYEENQITMDWDQPLENFDGMTAFQVTKHLGFACHVTQKAEFAWYLTPYETAAEIPLYNPCLYGLYRSLVGPDVQKNDLFENITPYAQQSPPQEELTQQPSDPEENATDPSQPVSQSQPDPIPEDINPKWLLLFLPLAALIPVFSRKKRK